MGISNKLKNAAGRYLGNKTSGTTGKSAGGVNRRRGTPASTGKGGGLLRGLLNRR